MLLWFYGFQIRAGLGFTDSAPREALWAKQGCGNVSLGVTESSPLDDGCAL